MGLTSCQSQGQRRFRCKHSSVYYERNDEGQCGPQASPIKHLKYREFCSLHNNFILTFFFIKSVFLHALTKSLNHKVREVSMQILVFYH